jgi:hypothetical protein
MLSIAGDLYTKKVRYELEHASAAFTLDIYCYNMDKMGTNAAGKLESILFPKAKWKRRR